MSEVAVPPDVQRVLQHRAELYVELSRHPGFEEMMRELERKQERMEGEFSLRMRDREPIDPLQVEYDRGFIAALKYIPLVVKGAERALEKLDAEASEPDDEGSNW
jgi:hypothetical protein